MKKGKRLEHLLRLIQEVLKDSASTKIYSNYKLKNIRGRGREIDILITSQVNNFEIKIAIECKDFKLPIPVEKIEAFNSKCQRIKGINKKIFVTSNGFQKDAKNAAEDFDIELFHLKDISPQTILQWFPIKQLSLKIDISNIVVLCDADSEEIKNINLNFDSELASVRDQTSENLKEFLLKRISEEKQKIWAYMMLDLLKRKKDEKIDSLRGVNFSINLYDWYILNNRKEKISLFRIDLKVKCWFEEKSVLIKETKIFENIGGQILAKTITLDLGNQTADIVFSSRENISIFHTDEQGNTQELRTMASYDSKSGKLDFFSTEQGK